MAVPGQQTGFEPNPRVNPGAFTETPGVAGGPDSIGVIGTNPSIGAFGFLGGKDLVFHQHAGVYGESDQQGVMGLGTVPGATGVYGGNIAPGGGDGIGVRGETGQRVGVQGQSFGPGIGVQGISAAGDGIAGSTAAAGKSGVFGFATVGNGVAGISANGIGVFGQGGALAAKFVGNVNVTGDISLVNEDCAEDFDVLGSEQIEPGTVMVLNPEGVLQQSEQAYDKKVAGVVSGAGDYKPGIILGKRDGPSDRLPIALLGKVYCKVDAQFSPIEVGDLLTTSPTPGHAMKAASPAQALGALIGKALRPLAEGQGMIPILVALQ